MHNATSRCINRFHSHDASRPHTPRDPNPFPNPAKRAGRVPPQPFLRFPSGAFHRIEWRQIAMVAQMENPPENNESNKRAVLFAKFCHSHLLIRAATCCGAAACPEGMRVDIGEFGDHGCGATSGYANSVPYDNVMETSCELG